MIVCSIFQYLLFDAAKMPSNFKERKSCLAGDTEITAMA